MIILIKSIIIGMFAIFPGVSGSSLAISLDIYDNLFKSLKNIKENYKYLLLVIIGLSAGIIFGSNIIIYLYNFKNIMYYIFIGLIIGSIPSMAKKVNKILYLPLIISFILSIISLFFCKNTFDNNVNFTKMVSGGILFSFGKIFPGVSSSFFLIMLGIYDEIMLLFSNPLLFFTRFLYYFPFIIGIIIGLLIFIKLLNYLLLKKYDLLYSVLIGFVLSSLFSILPKFELTFINFVGVLLMILSFIISFKFNEKKDI